MVDEHSEVSCHADVIILIKYDATQSFDHKSYEYSVNSYTTVRLSFLTKNLFFLLLS